MRTRNRYLWQPQRPWLSAGRIALIVALSPLLIASSILSVLLFAVMWPIRAIFPPAPLSAAQMVEQLDIALTEGADVDDVDEVLVVLGRCRLEAPELNALQQRIKRLDEAPLSADAIDELKAIRESAREIAAGDPA